MSAAISTIELFNLIACIGLCAGLVLGAGTPADEDLRQLSRYRLSLERMRRYAETVVLLRWMGFASWSDVESLDANALAGGVRDAGDEVLRVIEREGFTPMEFALIPLAIEAAECTLRLEQRGRRILAPGASAANVDLLHANRDEWSRIKRRMKDRSRPSYCHA